MGVQVQVGFQFVAAAHNLVRLLKLLAGAA